MSRSQPASTETTNKVCYLQKFKLLGGLHGIGLFAWGVGLHIVLIKHCV